MLSRRHLLFALSGLVAANALPTAARAAMVGLPAGMEDPLPPSAPMVAGDFVASPSAWFGLLDRNPELDPATVSFKPLKLTARLAHLIIKVNQEVNAAITYRADAGKDLWLVGGRYGDCEDFAIRKLVELTRKHGLPRGALTLAACWDARRRGHAVLLVHCDRGVYVMDNVTPHVLPWQRLPYKWVAREEPGAPFRLWRSLEARG